MIIGDDGWLVGTTDLATDPHQGCGVEKLFRSHTEGMCDLDLGRPEAVVWHWTGGPALGPAYAPALVKEKALPGKPNASWHFLVAKNGRVFQSVPTTRGAWHVGVGGYVGGPPVKTPSGWQVQTGRLVKNINTATLGIELENSGLLTVVDHGLRCDGYPNSPIAVERGVLRPEGMVDEFPAAQVAAATELLKAIVARFHQLDRASCSAGHVMYDPLRRRDPGSLWLEVLLPGILDEVFP